MLLKHSIVCEHVDDGVMLVDAVKEQIAQFSIVDDLVQRRLALVWLDEQAGGFWIDPKHGVVYRLGVGDLRIGRYDVPRTLPAMHNLQCVLPRADSARQADGCDG